MRHGENDSGCPGHDCGGPSVDGPVVDVELAVIDDDALPVTSAASSESGSGSVPQDAPTASTTNWTLDVAFREDESRLRAENAAENFAVVRHVALNLLRSVKGSKVGIKGRRLEAGWSEEFLMKVLAAHAN